MEIARASVRILIDR